MRCVKIQRLVTVRDVVPAVDVGRGIDIERHCEAPIALETRALVRARQLLGAVPLRGPRGAASGLDFLGLARAGDDDLALARLVFLAGVGRVAGRFVRVAACFLGLAAGLRARLVEGVFAFAGLVAGFTAEVGAAFELGAASLAAADVA